MDDNILIILQISVTCFGFAALYCAVTSIFMSFDTMVSKWINCDFPGIDMLMLLIWFLIIAGWVLMYGCALYALFWFIPEHWGWADNEEVGQALGRPLP